MIESRVLLANDLELFIGWEKVLVRETPGWKMREGQHVREREA